MVIKEHPYDSLRITLTIARRGRRTLRDLAAQLSLSHVAVGMYETGARIPPATRLIEWADALGYDVELVKR